MENKQDDMLIVCIREWLKATNRNGAEFARMVGVTRTTVTRWFNGSRKISKKYKDKILEIIKADKDFDKPVPKREFVALCQTLTVAKACVEKQIDEIIQAMDADSKEIKTFIYANECKADGDIARVERSLGSCWKSCESNSRLVLFSLLLSLLGNALFLYLLLNYH